MREVVSHIWCSEWHVRRHCATQKLVQKQKASRWTPRRALGRDFLVWIRVWCLQAKRHSTTSKIFILSPCLLICKMGLIQTPSSYCRVHVNCFLWCPADSKCSVSVSCYVFIQRFPLQLFVGISFSVLILFSWLLDPTSFFLQAFLLARLPVSLVTPWLLALPPDYRVIVER